MDMSHQITDHKQENCVVDQVESKPEGNKIKSLCVLWQLGLWTWTEPGKSQNTALLLVQLLANNTRASVTVEKIVSQQTLRLLAKLLWSQKNTRQEKNHYMVTIFETPALKMGMLTQNSKFKLGYYFRLNVIS